MTASAAAARASRFVGFLPGERLTFATEVSAGGRFLEDRATKLKMLDDSGGCQRKVLSNQFAKLRVVDLARSFGIDMHTDRLGDTDCVSELNFAAVSQPGGDDVLGHVAGHVGSRSVDLGRVLAAEGTTAVTTPTTVGVDNDLASGQATVAMRTANDELASRVDVILDVALVQLGWDRRLDDFLDDELLDLIVRHIGTVLGTDDDRVDSNGRVAFVLDRDLALVVGTKPVDFFVEAGFGDSIDDSMRQCDRQWHQLGRIFTGVAEHQSLVAGANVFSRLRHRN